MLTDSLPQPPYTPLHSQFIRLKDSDVKGELADSLGRFHVGTVLACHSV